MANLKRNMIKLVKNPEDAQKGGEIEYETFWTSPFISSEVTYEALDIGEKLNSEDNEMTEKEAMELLENFIADKAYGGQFTAEDIRKRLHGPELIEELRSQLVFITNGMQSDDTKNFLAKKR